MEIQQHDSVVVEAGVVSAGLRQAPTREREREVLRARGRRQGLGVAALPPPTIYSTPRGEPALGDPISKGGGQRPSGGLAPQVRWGAPHP